MIEKEDHFRASVLKVFRRKTPFTQLVDHIGKIRECTELLGENLIKYYKGDFKNFNKVAKKVSQLEHEADIT